MYNYLNDKNKRTGLITTVLIHLLLLVLFIFTGLTVPVPLPEQGILINFGNSDAGSGDIQPEELKAAEAIEPSEEQVVEESNHPEPAKTVEEVVTQNVEEAPAIAKTEPSNVKNETPEEKEPEKMVNPDALYKGKKSDEKPTGEGITNQDGDQGSIDGSKDSPDYTGSGKGDGFSLAGREIKFRYKPENQKQETGKVVVSIWVDRYGKVTRVTSDAKGSTTTDAYLVNLAKEAALKTQFSANPSAPAEQKGTMVFEFTVGR